MTANDVIKVASCFVGYQEKKTNANLDEFHGSNVGSNNYNRFARDTIGLWGNKQGMEWCTSFVAAIFTYCAYGDIRAIVNAGTRISALKAASDKAKADKFEKVKDVQPYGKYGASCTYQTKYYQQFLRWSYTPHAGDQAFFKRGHTGIVESYDGKTMILIEGNSNNRVERRAYSFPNDKFSGFGRPYYKANATVPKEEPTTAQTHTVVAGDTPERIARKYGITTKALLDANKAKYPTITIDFIRDGWVLTIPNAPKFTAYTGKVTSSNGLNVREGNNISYKKIGVLKLNQTVTILEEKSGWGRINYNGKDGWICLNWIERTK